MQKEYTLTEIKEMCGNARLTITSITDQLVMALNTKNGMQHLFRIKKLDPNDYIKKVEPKHIEQVKSALMEEDPKEEEMLKQRANTEKERIMESFKQLNKDNANLLNDTEDNASNKDDYVLISEYDKEVNDFALEPTPVIKEEVKLEKKEPLIKPKTTKTKGGRGRKPGSKNKKKEA